MLNVKLEFDEKWLEGKRKEHVHVLFDLERWLDFQEHFKLNSSSDKTMHVGVAEQYLEDFKKAFKEKIKKEYKVSNPDKVCTISVDEPESTDPSLFDVVEFLKSSRILNDDSDDNIDFDDEESERPNPNEVLKELLNDVPFKYSRALSEHLREIAEVVPMLQKMNSLKSFWNQTHLVSMDDGYGMTTFLESLCKLYFALGIADETFGKKPKPCEMLICVQPPEQGVYSDWDSAVEKAKQLSNTNGSFAGVSPILCLDICAWQNKLATDEVRSYLRKINVYAGNFTLIFKVPFMEARALKVVEAALGDVFSVRSLAVPPTSLENLTEYARDQLKLRNFSLKKDAESSVEKMILQEKSDASFFGFKTVDKIVETIIYEKAKSNCRVQKADRCIACEDLASYVAEDDPFKEDPKVKLNGLVGQQAVKDKIYQIIAQIKAYNNLPKAKKRAVGRPAIHMMFTGNPGTGKTTVARIVAELFHQEGILSKGHMIEVKARELCGEWIGSTSPKTSAICRDAYGSVLFIDEAYGLFKGDKSDRRDFGLEALAALIAEMENHRDDMCVIMAGYTDDMQTMLKGNIGLKDRIPFSIEFPNYSREELVKIFFMMADSGSFKYEKALETAVKDFFDKIPESIFSSKEFSNARLVRNLYERTWGKAACRSSLGEGDITLLASDLLGAAEENEFKQLLETRAVRKIRIGF